MDVVQYPGNTASSDQNLNEPVAAYKEVPTSAVSNETVTDNEMKRYWKILPEEKKKVLLDLIKLFVEDNRPSYIRHEEWWWMIKHRADFLAGEGKTWSREEAREILQSKEKRDELLNRNR